MRFLLYSHDGMGLGHVRRHLAIAAALVEAAPSAKVLVTTSVDEVSRLGLPPNVDTLKLPGLRKVANSHYSSRRLAIPGSEIRALRSGLLEQAVKSFHPAVVLVDKHPFGAGGEFRAALEAVKSSGGCAVLGLRDILDERAAVLKEWSPERVQDQIADYYDLVLVYGARAVFDPIRQYGLPAPVAERTRYCGYVVNQATCAWHWGDRPVLLAPRPDQQPTVLGTTGGGEDGFALLETFIRAAAGAAWKGVAVAGPMLSPRELEALRPVAAENQVAFYSFIPCLSELLWTVDGLVCMGGYNTLVEAAAKGVPTVCVPRSSPRAEQVLRAQAFERLGLLRCLPPHQLTVENLRAELAAALQTPRGEMLDRASVALDFGGARRAASHLVELARSVRRTKEGWLERTVS